MQDASTTSANDSFEGDFDIADDTPTPITMNFTTTQQDPELRTIEAVLELLQMLPYDTRVRALTYIRDRVESDPSVWSQSDLLPEFQAARGPVSFAPKPTATREDIARVLAHADGYVFGEMTNTEREVYYQRAKALIASGFINARESA